MTTFLTNPLPRKPSKSANVYNALSGGLQTGLGLMQQRDQQAQESAALQSLGLSPEVAQAARGNPKIMEALIGGQIQQKNDFAKQSLQNQKNRQMIRQLEKDRNLPEGALEAYVSNPSLANQVSKPQKELLSEKPIDADQLRRMNEVRAQQGYDNLSPAQKYRALTDAGVSRVNADSEVKASQAPFETESEKLEAKRVSELAQEIESEYSAAKNEDSRLERMGALDEKGNISTPLMIKTLDSIGLPIGILGNPDTEEFRKLEADFIRDVSKVFPGGRITNYDLQAYLKGIPGLMNTPEGRKAIIRNRKIFNEAKKIRYEAYKDIIKQNGGKKPANLGILVEEKTRDAIQDLEDSFIKGIDRQAKKFQQSIRMYDPEGFAIDIPPDEIETALKHGARFSK